MIYFDILEHSAHIGVLILYFWCILWISWCADSSTPRVAGPSPFLRTLSPHSTRMNCKSQHFHPSYCLLWMGLLLSTLRTWQMYIAEPSPVARHMGCPSTQPACDRAAATVLGLARVPSPSHITSYSRRSIPSATTRSNISLLVLLLSGDIAPNPGPAARDISPSGHCELPVNRSDQAVLYDSCEIWFHRSCHSMSATEYANLQSDISWKCYRCNHPISNTYHSYELHDSSLDHSSDTSTILRGRFYSASSLPSPGSAFFPQSHSTSEA